MPRLIVTAGARDGLVGCRSFLAERSDLAAQRAGRTILDHLRLLETSPELGRPAGEGLREMLIPFGDSGYLVLYRHESAQDSVYLLAIRHQRKAGF